MQHLRSTKSLIRFVMLWFVLALGVAVASPIVNPQSTQLICGANGNLKLITVGDEGAQEVGSAAIDCPLCMTSCPLPPQAHSTEPLSLPMAHVLQPVAAAHIAYLTSAPLPARGPPHHLS